MLALVQSRTNLCFNDNFASAWGGTNPKTDVCPRVNHKDLYVEHDYMSSHPLSQAALERVIKAFGNAPVTNTGTDNLDAYQHTNGITLHIVKDESITEDPTFSLWTDFFPLKASKFGTSTERGTTDWATSGKAEKNYAYHYALGINKYGQDPCNTSSGSYSSGLGEILGNDLVVSLGCGFTGTNGNDDEQAGTFMHELGHNLNLRHGGFTGAGSSNYNMACKPNYLSVMSYSRQMSSGGFLSATQWNALAGDHESSLDYSRYGSPGTAGTPTIPDLTESSLIENNGLVTSDGKKYYIP